MALAETKLHASPFFANQNPAQGPSTLPGTDAAEDVPQTCARHDAGWWGEGGRYLVK